MCIFIVIKLPFCIRLCFSCALGWVFPPHTSTSSLFNLSCAFLSSTTRENVFSLWPCVVAFLPPFLPAPHASTSLLSLLLCLLSLQHTLLKGPVFVMWQKADITLRRLSILLPHVTSLYLPPAEMNHALPPAAWRAYLLSPPTPPQGILEGCNTCNETSQTTLTSQIREQSNADVMSQGETWRKSTKELNKANKTTSSCGNHSNNGRLLELFIRKKCAG